MLVVSLLDKYLYEIQKLQGKEAKKVKDEKVQNQKSKKIQISDCKIFFGPNGFPTIVKF